jgi:DMSO/TMAO reductase YedYZ molybdopterin-dependent catalytic subunit
MDEIVKLVQPLPQARFAVFYSFSEGPEGGLYYDAHKVEHMSHHLTILAYEMNGEPLSHQHGCPARLFTPGYFGTNQVKWLRKLTVTAQRPEHLFTTHLYQRTQPGSPRPVPVRDRMGVEHDTGRQGRRRR